MMTITMVVIVVMAMVTDGDVDGNENYDDCESNSRQQQQATLLNSFLHTFKICRTMRLFFVALFSSDINKKKSEKRKETFFAVFQNDDLSHLTFKINGRYGLGSKTEWIEALPFFIRTRGEFEVQMVTSINPAMFSDYGAVVITSIFLSFFSSSYTQQMY